MMDADFPFIKKNKISWNFLHRDYTQYWDLVFLGEQVGRYEYKFIVDGNWVTNPELPLSEPNREGQVNNYLEVQLLSYSQMCHAHNCSRITKFMNKCLVNWLINRMLS